MKITIECYGKKFSVETQNDDLDISEYLEIYYGMLIQLTFNTILYFIHERIWNKIVWGTKR